MTELTEKLAELLDDKNDKNYDPRMEELMRSDKLIDPKAENLSKLEDPEIFHIAKIRGLQVGLRIPVWKLQRIYNADDMLDYTTDYMEFTRSLKATDPGDKKILESSIGGLAMTEEAVAQLICLRGALDAWKAKLYADSIKPAVANIPMPMQREEEQEGLLSKMANLIFGRKKEEPRYQR